MTTLTERLAEIRARLATPLNVMEAHLNVKVYKADLAFLLDTLEAALSAFEKYGQHLSECHLMQSPIHRIEDCGDPCPLCTCGLEATMDTFTQRTEAGT